MVFTIFSCVKKKKGNCEFHRLEFIEYRAGSLDIKIDKTILECLQLEVKDDRMIIANKAKTISLKFSVSDENIVEDLNIDLDGDIQKSFGSADEQEMELSEKPKSWEISIKSDNHSRFNGYIKLYKTSDGDYWKLEKENTELTAK